MYRLAPAAAALIPRRVVSTSVRFVSSCACTLGAVLLWPTPAMADAHPTDAAAPVGKATPATESRRLRTLETLDFDNSYLRELPIDEGANRPRQVSRRRYPQRVRGTWLDAHTLVAVRCLAPFSPRSTQRRWRIRSWSLRRPTLST